MAVSLKTKSERTSPLAWLGAVIERILPVVTFLTALGTFVRFGVDPLAWLAVYGMTTYQVAMNFDKFKEAFISSWIVFLVPLLTLISTFWSAAAGHTMSVSIQFIFTTMFGLWLGAVYSPRQIFRALAIAAAVGVIASVINGQLQFISAYSNYDGFFVGIFTQKNVLGRVIVLLSVSLFVVSIATRNLLVFTIGAMLVVALFFPLNAAESATSLVMYLFVLTFPVVWLFVSGSESMRLVVVLSAVGALLLGLGVTAVVDIDLVNKVLAKLGKDSTLTGRTYIWSVGWQMVQWKPILGLGFDAFWFGDTFDEPALIAEAYGEAINGFHNAFLEVLVSLGIVGEIAFIATLLAVLFRVFRWLFAERSVESLGAAYILTIMFIMSFVEIIGFRNHDINHILMVMFYAMAYYRLHGRNTSRQPA